MTTQHELTERDRPECLGDGVCTNPRCPTHGIKWTFDGGTRSVEIPDEAVRAAVHAAGGTGAIEPVAMHAALVAARPYLLPTREQIAEAMHDHQMESHGWRQGCREDVCIGIFLDRADAVMAAFFTGKVAGK